VAEAALERTVRFRAHHRYRRSDWSEERNREAFGPVAEPHPHEYVVTVTVRGEIDAHGFVVDLVALDALLAARVRSLDGSDLNARIFHDGRMQPTTEALARWVWEQLSGAIPGAARLTRVRVAESGALAAEYEG
jgi:6-pyruvoyltetrahydropterin/6-carboxytetrahydropterin synthase